MEPATPLQKRNYSTIINKSTTRNLCFEIRLAYPEVVSEKHFTIQTIILGPSGSIGEFKDITYLKEGWVFSHHTKCWGWKQSGYWLAGDYQVFALIDSQVIARKTFKIF